MSWYDAERSCRSMGGTLPLMKSPTKSARHQNYIYAPALDDNDIFDFFVMFIGLRPHVSEILLLFSSADQKSEQSSWYYWFCVIVCNSSPNDLSNFYFKALLVI